MLHDDTWPPTHAREEGNLLEWISHHANLGRWVAHDEVGAIVGHAAVGKVAPDQEADIWLGALECDINRLAKISRLIVSPLARRAGVSALITNRCVRGTVEDGFIPVASAFASSTTSLKMMKKHGWAVVGSSYGSTSLEKIVLLIPPQKLVDAALEKPLKTVTRESVAEDCVKDCK